MIQLLEAPDAKSGVLIWIPRTYVEEAKNRLYKSPDFCVCASVCVLYI